MVLSLVALISMFFAGLFVQVYRRVQLAPHELVIGNYSKTIVATEEGDGCYPPQNKDGLTLVFTYKDYYTVSARNFVPFTLVNCALYQFSGIQIPVEVAALLIVFPFVVFPITYFFSHAAIHVKKGEDFDEISENERCEILVNSYGRQAVKLEDRRLRIKALEKSTGSSSLTRR